MAHICKRKYGKSMYEFNIKAGDKMFCETTMNGVAAHVLGEE